MQKKTSVLLDRALACWNNARVGRSNEGLVEARQLLDEAMEDGDLEAAAACNRCIGYFCLQLGYPDEGLIAANAARTYYTNTNDTWGYALSLAVYSWLLLEIGLSDFSFETASEAVIAAGKTDDLALQAFALNSKSLALVLVDECDVALGLLTQALDLALASGDASTIALTNVDLAYANFVKVLAAQDDGDYQTAEKYLAFGFDAGLRAIVTARETGDLVNLRVALCNHAEMLARTGKTNEGLSHLNEVEKLPGVAGARADAHYYQTRGDVLERLNRNDEAVMSYMKAEKLALVHSLHAQMVQTFRRLSDINAKLGKYREAYLYHQTYHQAYVRQASELVRMRQMVTEMEMQTEALRKRAVELEMQVGVDPLTNVPNRRSFNRDFEQLNHHRAAVAILDIDYFKHVNDFYSHAVGDVVLTRVAQALNQIDPKFKVYRIGGEEFAGLFVDMSLEDAEPLALKAVEAVRALDFSDVAEHLSVTISVGLVEAGVLTGPALLAEADRRLYVAKKNGRDQVISDNRPSMLAIPAE